MLNVNGMKVINRGQKIINNEAELVLRKFADVSVQKFFETALEVVHDKEHCLDFASSQLVFWDDGVEKSYCKLIGGMLWELPQNRKFSDDGLVRQYCSVFWDSDLLDGNWVLILLVDGFNNLTIGALARILDEYVIPLNATPYSTRFVESKHMYF